MDLKYILGETEQYLGMSMTFSLFEWVKENLETLLGKLLQDLNITV